MPIFSPGYPNKPNAVSADKILIADSEASDAVSNLEAGDLMASGLPISVDTISEKTSANGVTIDGLNIKDGKLNTNNSVVTSNITDGSVTSAKLDPTVSTYTPTFANVSGGTATGHYSQFGKLMYFRAVYLLAGAGVSGSVTVSLPASLSTIYSVNTPIGLGRIRKGSGTSYSVEVRANQSTSSTSASLFVDAAGGTYVDSGASPVGATVPVGTWANGDSIVITGVYLAA